jgi:hypothetical protein
MGITPDAGADVADPANPLPSNRAAPSLGGPTGRTELAFFLEPQIFNCQRASSVRLRLIGVAARNDRLGD